MKAGIAELSNKGRMRISLGDMPSPIIRSIAKGIFGLRIPGNPLHRALSWEWQLRHFAFYELARIFYYQPMFESRCASVGSGTRLELTPDSLQPPVYNVDVHLGERVRLSARTTFSGARNAPTKPRIVVGDDSYIGHRVTLRAGTEITIGRHVLLASNITLSADPGHPLDPIRRRTEAAPAESLGKIVIGDDAWLAYNVSVLGNVTIGEGAVVGANSVVTKDVPAYALVAGNPARVIKMLDGSPITLEMEKAKENNTVKLPDAERARVRSSLKRHYLELFSTSQAPSESELDAVVDRAMAELEGKEPEKRSEPKPPETQPEAP